ncbi:MAG: type II secretion system protein [Legionellales bacterium]
MKRNAGFVFLMALMTVAVVSLLVLACMQHILLYHKAMNKLELQHQGFHQLEALAIQLAHAKLSELDAGCFEFGDSVNQVIRRLMQHEGCLLSVDKHHYKYLIEELGDFPCLVAQQDGVTFSTHHRRVTVLSTASDNADTLLQVRQISAIKYQPCLGEAHDIALGVGSWRYFAAVDVKFNNRNLL